MYRFSSRSLDRLEYVSPILIKILEEGIKNSPYDFGIPRDGGFRTFRRQEELYARGRTTEQLIEKGITDLEGRPDKSRITWTLKSYHMTGKAFDIFAIDNNGRASWDMKYLEPIARHLIQTPSDYGIILNWGYDLWGKDGAHFQID
jgi:peptidoglycan L-alanyl-D-glutamate endopeptidase CwlK